MNDNDDPFQKLLIAISNDDSQTASSLIAGGLVNVNETTPPPLIAAARRGRVEIMTMLLDAGANINVVDAALKSACHAAVENGHLSALDLLIARGANLALLDHRGYSPLVYASRRKYDLFTVALLDAGVAVDSLQESELFTVAAQSANVLSRLIKRNVDVKSVRGMMLNRTLCHVVAQSQRQHDVLEHLRLLVEVVGIDIDERDKWGCTALHCAAGDNATLLRAVILLGADIDAVDSAGLTALNSLCGNSYSDIGCVELLLAAGANSRIGEPCHFAAQRNPAALLALLAAGADLDEPNSSNQTPRQLAATYDVALPTDDDITLVRRRIAAIQLEFVRNRATEVCIGLQSRGLDALQLCEIMVHACGPVAPAVPFHRWWKIVTTVKHFHTS
jgi:ankyrin repeat protein